MPSSFFAVINKAAINSLVSTSASTCPNLQIGLIPGCEISELKGMSIENFDTQCQTERISGLIYSPSKCMEQGSVLPSQPWASLSWLQQWSLLIAKFNSSLQPSPCPKLWHMGSCRCAFPAPLPGVPLGTLLCPLFLSPWHLKPFFMASSLMQSTDDAGS